MFYTRTITPHLLRLGEKFPIVLVTGARQVGKSTLLTKALPNATYVTLDDPELRALAETEPKLFLARYKPPVIIDEVQYAPNLFPLLKMHVDASEAPGSYWLSGSQQFHLMKHVSESLAGRIAILQVFGLTTRELLKDPGAPPLPARLEDLARPRLELDQVFDRIWRGSYPALHGKGIAPEEFYPSYVQTYLQRDVRDLARVGDERAFFVFMQLVAARTGQLLNVSELANAADISVTAAKARLSILEASGIVAFLQPYHGNTDKRLVKAPKLYVLDTGLAAWLAGWRTADALQRGTSAGAFLETYVVGEILKGYAHHAKAAPLHFYRDHEGREIDLLAVTDNIGTPLEVKLTSRPDGRTARKLRIGTTLGIDQGDGAIISMVASAYPLGGKVSAWPVGFV